MFFTFVITQKKMKKPFVAFLALTVLIFSCKKRKLNSSLYEEAKASGLSFYKGKDTLWGPAGGSPHGPFKLKFNSTAASALGSDGKLAQGSSFPNGSLILKEAYSGSSLSLYVIMKKESSKFSTNGWLWAEIEPDGDTKYSVGEKGASCKSCHSNSTNRDYTRSFDLH